MSRGQENQVVNESQQQNANAVNNAQKSYTAAQGDIGSYQTQLGEYAAANPYTQGGQFQTEQNKVLSNTADAAGEAAGQAMQSQAVRTGQNAGGAIAGTEATAQANERALAAQEATAEQQRIGSQAGYNQNVLQATAKPVQMETGLTGQQLNAQTAALSTQEKAAQQPSIGDQLLSGTLAAGQSFARGLGSKVGACWIAARLFGGWGDPRTKKVRAWIFGPLAATWYGWLPTRLYARYGKFVAEEMMPRSPLLTWALRKLFEAALRRAEAWEQSIDGCGDMTPQEAR